MLWKGWEGTKPGPHTSEAWLKARKSFIKRSGVQPTNGPAVVYSRASFVTREHLRREASDAARYRQLESIPTVAAEGSDPDRRIDAQRAIECLFQHLSPRDLQLVWEMANNTRPSDWRDYEQSSGSNNATRHKRVCATRKRVLEVLIARGFAYLLWS
jgi:hypothetical protein